MAVRYAPDEQIPSWEDFGAAIAPLLKDYEVILEPGRSIVRRCRHIGHVAAVRKRTRW